MLHACAFVISWVWRYLFAAGRFNQLPELLAMISIKFYSPVLSIVIMVRSEYDGTFCERQQIHFVTAGIRHTIMWFPLQCIISLIYCQIPNVNMLVEYASLGVQLKILTALVALLYFRYKRPHIHRPIKVKILWNQPKVLHAYPSTSWGSSRIKSLVVCVKFSDVYVYFVISCLDGCLLML